jgi:hypothetical protein
MATFCRKSCFNAYHIIVYMMFLHVSTLSLLRPGVVSEIGRQAAVSTTPRCIQFVKATT